MTRLGWAVLLAVLVALGAGAEPAIAHGGWGVPPPEPEPEPPPDPVPPPPAPPPIGPPNSSTPPGSHGTPPPGPTTPPAPGVPGPPITPPGVEPGKGPGTGGKDEPPGTPPDGAQPGPETPSPDGRRRPSVRSGRRAGASSDQGWRVWWEYNREHLVGRRHLLRGAGVVTGRPSGQPVDPLGAERAAVVERMRLLATGTEDRLVRSSAILALGRIGTQWDASLFVRLMNNRKQADDVREAASLALGMLGPIEDKTLKAAVREHLVFVLRHRSALPTRARELAVVAAGLRARDDRLLLIHLADRAAHGAKGANGAAALVFACGLAGDPILLPEVSRAALKGRLGPARLSDVGRSHAVQALARLGEPVAARQLVQIARSRRAGVQARRAAVLGLGRMLRLGRIDGDAAKRARQALVRLVLKSGDVLVRGFAALAVGGAETPGGIRELMDAIDHGGHAGLKPFAALALGLAARNGAGKERIGAFLVEELDKTNDLELSSALCLASGLARAKRADKVLLARVRDSRKPAAMRGAAAQGLGLLGRVPVATENVLVDLLHSGSRDLTGEIALALGMLGRRSTAPVLVEMLERAGSTADQGRIMLALGHLGHAAATAPLVDVLEDRRKRPVIREFAAVALGLLGDLRREDVLFELDADFNYFATTTTTHELIRLY